MTGYEFEAELWLWDARRVDTWTFVSLPPDISEEIAERAQALPRAGFGSVRVEVTVGRTSWRTSIFPAAPDRYDLPVKKAVRKAESLDPGDRVSVTVELVDL
ncbi:MAG TPA: DUF1905 domain-containing protein [Lapillicoccus sp.]|nr:DUF1905 domain-containing protein [Lapillicoccus sp.]